MKRTIKKLGLGVETVRSLSALQLQEVQGGKGNCSTPNSGCKETISATACQTVACGSGETCSPACGGTANCPP